MWFYNIIHCPLEDIGRCYAALPNVNILMISELLCSLISPPILSERSLSIGKLSSSLWSIQVIQTSNFHPTAGILLLITSAVCFPWSDKLALFSRKRLPNTKVWKSSLSISHSFEWKYCCMVTARSACSLIAQVLFLKRIVRYQKCFMHIFCFGTQNIRDVYSEVEI